MNYLLGFFLFAFLVARTHAQVYGEETLHCDKPVPTIFKLGDASCPCNKTDHAGAIKYANGKVHVCLGTEWKTLPFESNSPYGTRNNPAYSCKDILDNAEPGQQHTDGVYWIRLRGRPAAFPVYCDMATGGWTMVFKIASGVSRVSNKLVWDIYRSSETANENVTAALDVTNQYQDHYKNRVILYWDTFNAMQARVSLYKNSISQKELLFNALGTDKLNWFSAGKLISSSWPSIKTTPTNYFSVQGHCHSNACRSFFINKSYAGCPNDFGWLVGSTSSTWCSWESNNARKFNILYSKLNTYTNWNTAGNVGLADAMVVFLK
ncbi:uncharacterized protein LOC114966768 [Acropora millepora]|uniref:uncharacterized protein LOC114966768 n=1 Tax=Acropora millepora TaxID=45264 RepID=UPI001CF29C28|nr:uncharacterized protein LOC114966768 [Acropora millepora]